MYTPDPSKRPEISSYENSAELPPAKKPTLDAHESWQMLTDDEQYLAVEQAHDGHENLESIQQHQIDIPDQSSYEL